MAGVSTSGTATPSAWGQAITGTVTTRTTEMRLEVPRNYHATAAGGRSDDPVHLALPGRLRLAGGHALVEVALPPANDTADRNALVAAHVVPRVLRIGDAFVSPVRILRHVPSPLWPW